MILLLGPRPEDPVLAAFGAYLRAHATSHEFCSDLSTLRFGVILDRDGGTQIRLRLPGAGEVPGDEVGVFVHNPWGWQATKGGRTERFIATEYHSSLWTLCALLPRVMNRPGRWAWLHERELRYALPEPAYLSEYWTSSIAGLTARWKADGSAQAHVEDLLSAERRVFTTADELLAWRSGPTQLRALFAPASRYLIQVCVGSRATTVLNELEYEVDSPDHRSFLARVVESLATKGVHFFALAMVMETDGCVRLARIVTEPPWSWYARYADEVHGNLSAWLGATE